MSAVLERKPISPSAEFPRKPPMKNYTPFENPEPRCIAYLCPSFALPSCIYCELHCVKFHKGMHVIDNTITDLIEKYSKINDEEQQECKRDDKR